MAALVSAQSDTQTDQKVYRILAGKLFDSRERRLLLNQVITVDKTLGVILDVKGLEELQGLPEHDGVEFINCSQLTSVPGFVDAHVHLFLHAYSETSWNDQVTKESLVERTIRATVHAHKTLMAGFTTVRDLGTEGALDADIDLRRCLSGREPIILGPRYYCANRAIVTTGSYGPKSSLHPSSDGVEGIMGADVADGIDGCIRAVRRQIGVGADWVKLYADSDGVRTQIGSVSLSLGPESLSTFDREELRAMISTAHKLGVKVAAHANTSAAIHDCLDLGVDSIEHGAGIFSNENEDVGLIQKLAAAKGRTKWVPTLAAYYKISQYSKAPGKVIWDRAKATFVKAVIEGGLDNVACGGDTGVFNHGENALELVLMRQLGAPWEKILSWATLGGWECIRGSEWDGEAGAERIRKLEETPGLSLDLDRGVPFGVIRRGWAADLVGIEGDMTGTPTEFERAVTEGVKVVIKAGKIVKQ